MKPKKNKYAPVIDSVLDLHGYTTSQAIDAVDAFLRLSRQKQYTRVSLITGKGNRSLQGSVLKPTIQSYLLSHNLSFRDAKIQEGGSGAIIVSLSL
jgi:DNA-nicking Smr family endonuclease